MGDVGTAAARSPPARWVAEDESDRTALGDARPDGAQGGAGGAQFGTKDWLCSQLPVTVVGMFSWLRRVPQAFSSAAATVRLPVVLLESDNRQKLVFERCSDGVACSRQEHP